jgi:hypothetical protein
MEEVSDPVPFSYSQVEQRIGQPIDVFIELSPGEPLFPVDNAFLVGPVEGSLFQEGPDIHFSIIQRAYPPFGV